MLKRDKAIALARRGFSADDIASQIGSTAGSVRVMLHNARLQGLTNAKLRREYEQLLLHPLKVPVTLSPEAWALLIDEATRRKVPPKALAERLMEAIITANLYAAVLDTD
jgi:hypothetical protein